MKITGWSLLIAMYVIWNTSAYMAPQLFGDDYRMYDYVYWVNERVFVIICFWSLIGLVPTAYKWIFKVLVCVAISKLVYLLLVITKVIQRNDFASLMGLLFTLVISITVFLWEKRSKRSRTH